MRWCSSFRFVLILPFYLTVIQQITGSIDWRLSRGELGSGAAAAAAVAASSSSSSSAPSSSSASASSAAVVKAGECEVKTEEAVAACAVPLPDQSSEVPAPSVVAVAPKAELSKAELAALVKRYFVQLTQGCAKGRAGGKCANPHCRQSQGADAPSLAPTEAAKQALALAVQHHRAGLCPEDE
jgi:CCR4-NOT transcriptional regulation complex NOT5 subunit